MAQRTVPLALACSLILMMGACTGNASVAPPRPSPNVSGSRPIGVPSSGAPPIALDVVADLTLGSADQTYLDGMKLGISDVNAGGGVAGHPLSLSTHGDDGTVRGAREAISAELQAKATAIVYAGPGAALAALRGEFEQTGTPVVLMEGDLYTPHALFREVFQTSVPWQWQAHVIARYVVRDRKAKDVVFVGAGPEAVLAARVLRDEMAYWGGRLAAAFTDASRDPKTGFTRASNRAAKADWVVVFGPPWEPLELANAVEEASANGGKPGITGPASLLVDTGGLARPEPGTTACYTYTWAGWAHPIKRVARFEAAFDSFVGHAPSGLEQEGYDAIRTLAAALGQTGGRGGPDLVRALEGVHRIFSSLPVDLGPDDHTFMPRDELGLFAVAGPKERLDPWEQPGAEPWRALMRTFTYDGTRTNVLDQDRRVFFPFWSKDQPGPEYWRSRYGITTRPSADLLH